MKIFIAIGLFLCLGLAQAGYHPVVTPDILHHVSKVLSHGYGQNVVLGYPEKAHLVGYGVTVQETPYHHGHHHHHHDHYPHVVGHYGHAGHEHGHGHYGYGHGHYHAVPAYLGYAGTGGHEHGHGHGHYHSGHY